MAVMTYHDLPPNIRELALTDPVLAADVVDLVLSHEDRRSGCLGLMVCDEKDRGVQPIVLSDVPEHADIETLGQLLDLVLPPIGQDRGGVLVGRGRRRGLLPTDTDRAWHQRVIEGCRVHGVRLLGYHLATPEGVRALPEPLTAAS
jgi:hypothetical protein